jgi:2,3-bisphosphoglycerate-dependent phosphoglycerate mutase
LRIRVSRQDGLERFLIKSTEIYMVRHGQSWHNQQDRIAGQHDSGLTELGFEDAQNVARVIGRSDFEMIYCSDLLRACQTADTIIQTLRLNCPMRLSSLLRELDYGDFTERSVEETFAFLNYKWVQQQAYPGGESFQDLQRRIQQFICQLLAESAGQRILVIAHAGSIRLMAMQLDASRKQEHLDRAYGNRFLAKAELDNSGGLVSFAVVQNPERGAF